MFNDSVMVDVLVGVVSEGVAALRVLMAGTRSRFVGELFMVFMAEESVTVTFRLLRSRLRSTRPCVSV